MSGETQLFLLALLLALVLPSQQVEDLGDTLETDKTTQEQEISTTTKPPLECREIQKLKNTNGSQFFNVSETIFYFNATYLTWYKARDLCSERGMKLPIFKNELQVDAVNKELKKRGFPRNNFWLSGSDIGRKAGQIQWADGTLVDNSSWFPGQPDDFITGQETCVNFNTHFNQFWDWPCSGFWYVLCEVPMTLSSCVLRDQLLPTATTAP